MNFARHKTTQQRRGAVAIMAAACMVALLGILALTLDAGGLMSERRHGQATADAAALAAACDLFDNYWANTGADPDGTALASAFQTAKDNGYTNDGTASIVTVNIPPTSGDYAKRRGYVEVIVQYNQARTFSNIFARGPIPVKARAVAIGAAIAADVGILVLNPTQKGALNAQGGGLTLVQDTPVVVNSNSDSAAIAGGGGTMTADKFMVTGNTNTTGGGTFNGPSGIL